MEEPTTLSSLPLFNIKTRLDTLVKEEIKKSTSSEIILAKCIETIDTEIEQKKQTWGTGHKLDATDHKLTDLSIEYHTAQLLLTTPIRLLINSLINGEITLQYMLDQFKQNPYHAKFPEKIILYEIAKAAAENEMKELTSIHYITQSSALTVSSNTPTPASKILAEIDELSKSTPSPTDNGFLTKLKSELDEFTELKQLAFLRDTINKKTGSMFCRRAETSISFKKIFDSINENEALDKTKHARFFSYLIANATMNSLKQRFIDPEITATDHRPLNTREIKSIIENIQKELRNYIDALSDKPSDSNNLEPTLRGELEKILSATSIEKIIKQQERLYGNHVADTAPRTVPQGLPPVHAGVEPCDTTSMKSSGARFGGPNHTFLYNPNLPPKTNKAMTAAAAAAITTATTAGSATQANPTATSSTTASSSAPASVTLTSTSVAAQPASSSTTPSSAPATAPKPISATSSSAPASVTLTSTSVAAQPASSSTTPSSAPATAPKPISATSSSATSSSAPAPVIQPLITAPAATTAPKPSATTTNLAPVTQPPAPTPAVIAPASNPTATATASTIKAPQPHAAQPSPRTIFQAENKYIDFYAEEKKYDSSIKITEQCCSKQEIDAPQIPNQFKPRYYKQINSNGSESITMAFKNSNDARKYCTELLSNNIITADQHVELLNQIHEKTQNTSSTQPSKEPNKKRRSRSADHSNKENTPPPKHPSNRKQSASSLFPKKPTSTGHSSSPPPARNPLSPKQPTTVS